MPIRQVEVPYARGYDFGVGADLASGSPMGKVVEGPASPVENAGGAVMQFRVERIQSTEELETALGIDAEASYGCGAFGAGVSARFSFAKSDKVQSSSLFMTVTARIELGFLSIDAPALTPNAAALTDKPDAFAGRYGNMFVRGIGRGGLFVGLLRIATSSAETSNKIAGEISGSYGLFSAEAKMKFEEISKQAGNEIFIDIYREGGPLVRVDRIDSPLVLLDQVNNFLEAFEREPDRFAKAYFVTLAPVEIAEGPLPLNAADLQHVQDVLAACAKARSRLLDKINLLEYFLGSPEKFEPGSVDQQALNASLAAYQADLDLVAACASNAIRSPAEASMPAAYAPKMGRQYPTGKLPDAMPVPNEAVDLVAVPSFDDCKNWAMCNQAATEAGLVAQQSFAAMEQADNFRILNVSPPSGTEVPEGAVVTIVTQPTKMSRWGKYILIGKAVRNPAIIDLMGQRAG